MTTKIATQMHSAVDEEQEWTGVTTHGNEVYTYIFLYDN